MKAPSVPTPDQARTYNYTFTPVPMDEPPIDRRTFNHYFHKPHWADSSETWIRRFPQLVDSSLYYGNEKLAKGWGVEITEDRNWTVFVGVNLLVMVICGGFAGVFARVVGDPQTGVAVGAWATAVQALVVNALFWRWTNG